MRPSPQSAAVLAQMGSTSWLSPPEGTSTPGDRGRRGNWVTTTPSGCGVGVGCYNIHIKYIIDECCIHLGVLKCVILVLM